MLRFGLIVAAVVIAVDQASKAYFLNLLEGGLAPPIQVTPFFNLVTVWNYGVSFGMFNTRDPAGAWILSGVAVAIVSGLLVWLSRVQVPLMGLALGLVIGGALGNVIDRIREGAVFDFADFHAFGWHWPAFNVADSAITVGVLILLIDALFASPRSSK